jgi:hypothetical protein
MIPFDRIVVLIMKGFASGELSFISDFFKKIFGIKK